MKTGMSNIEQIMIRMKGLLSFSFILVLIFGSGIFLDIQAAIPSAEREALIALYNSTDGDNWTDNSGWKVPPLDADGFAMPGTEGNWYGINIQNDVVFQINLGPNHLSGSIPYELQNLSHLWYLSLQDNILTGEIPAWIDNLINLRGLYLWGNEFTEGPIPSAIGNLLYLEGLALDNCNLTGNIPSNLNNLSHLTYLSLSQNQLTGDIPPWLGNLNNFQTLWLRSNNFTGPLPPELGNLSNLKNLHLRDNHLTGNIPEELGNCSNLEELDLRGNILIGNIPESLLNLINLTSWTYIGHNGLYTYNDVLRTFLTIKCQGWEDTQTIPPQEVTADVLSDTSVKVSWTPIPFTAYLGEYHIFFSQISGGPIHSLALLRTSQFLRW